MDIRTAIYQKRIDAKANIRYFSDLEDRYQWRARGLQFIGLLCGTGAVGAFAVTLAPGWATTTLGAVAGLAGAALIAFRYADAVPALRSATRHWLRRSNAWDGLWLDVETDPGSVDVRRLAAEIRADHEFDAPQIRWDAKLALRAEQDTYRALGLPLPAP
jgi:hypothetical protein